MAHEFSNKQEALFEKLRLDMVRNQIRMRGVKDPRVLETMRKVPRHLFVPSSEAHQAYEDHPLPIGENQTISQPYIVAYMTELLELSSEDTVLEIGVGSGYQAAILAELCREVYSVEIVESLAKAAEQRLREMRYDNVHVSFGDGYAGWPEHAPYDGIIGTAAPEMIPPALTDQLADGGRMIIPVGVGYQELVLIRREGTELHEETLIPVRFVPMTRNP